MRGGDEFDLEAVAVLQISGVMLLAACIRVFVGEQQAPAVPSRFFDEFVQRGAIAGVQGEHGRNSIGHSIGDAAPNRGIACGAGAVADSMSTHHLGIELGRIGVWRGGRELDPDLAVELERLGYGTIWVGGSPNEDLAQVEALLEATSTIALATGVVNIWRADPATVAASYHRIEARYPGRFLLGVGVGHPEHDKVYAKPHQALVDCLDALDAAGVPAHRRALAALGPRVLRLAGARSAGAHPYLTVPEHTRQARELLGDGPLLAPEHKVVIGTDPQHSREIARDTLGLYLKLENYLASFRRLGYDDEDFANGGSDRLVDALVLHGDIATVAAGVTAHLDVGADHVAVRVLGDDPLTGFRALAEALALTPRA